MTQPTPYVPAFSFTDYTANHPSDQQPGVRLDTEFAAIRTTTDQTRLNLGLIQRDDGALRNLSVGPDQLSPELTLGLRSVSDWATGVAFVPNDAVWDAQKLYRCEIGHTSGPSFASDLAANKWLLLLDLGPYATTAAQAAVTAAVLAGISLDVDLGPINTALASKAGLATNNTLSGSNTFSGAALFTGPFTSTRGVATSAQDYAAFKPTDFGAAKPGLFVRKKAGATDWALEVDDGAGGGGNLDLPPTTTIGGQAPAFAAAIPTLQTAIRRARNLGLNRR